MKIAVFLPGWVGDVVMATPALRALRHQFPRAEMIAIQKPYVAGVLEGSPWIDRSIIMDRRLFGDGSWLDVVHKLRRESIDVAAIFPNSYRHALVAWLGQCKERIGFVRYGRGSKGLMAAELKPDGSPGPSSH